jgi:hypothetical protein
LAGLAFFALPSHPSLLFLLRTLQYKSKPTDGGVRIKVSDCASGAVYVSYFSRVWAVLTPWMLYTEESLYRYFCSWVTDCRPFFFSFFFSMSVCPIWDPLVILTAINSNPGSVADSLLAVPDPAKCGSVFALRMGMLPAKTASYSLWRCSSHSSRTCTS